MMSTRLVVEWRALTVALLDRLAPLVRDGSASTPPTSRSAQMLEGGTWAAGRKHRARRAARRRAAAHIVSDGTVF